MMSGGLRLFMFSVLAVFLGHAPELLEVEGLGPLHSPEECRELYMGRRA